MAIAELNHPSAVEGLVERAGNAVGSITGEVEELVADIGRQAAETGSDLAAEGRRATADAELRTGAAVVVAALLAIGLSVLIVLLRRRADHVRAMKL